MILYVGMARMRKTGTGNSKPAEVKDKEGNAPALKLRRGKKEYSGSRWAALVLLILTILAGLWFYIDGLGGWQGLSEHTAQVFSPLKWEKTYRFEKE